MTNGITAEKAIEAARDSKGFVTTIARRLGCSRQHVYNLMDKYATFKAAIDEEREGNKDFAEAKLFEQINAGNITGIIFYLKTQARDRGYIEKAQIEVIQKELDKTLDILERELSPEDYERILGVLADAGS